MMYNVYTTMLTRTIQVTQTSLIYITRFKEVKGAFTPCQMGR